MDQILQSKDKEWLNGLKKKKTPNDTAAYKRLTLRTYILRAKGWNCGIFQTNNNQKKQ